jgi:hypothetical protein
MTEMTVMEFTDELSLQPARRPVPEPQAGDSTKQISGKTIIRVRP